MVKNIIPFAHGGCGLINKVVSVGSRETLLNEALKLKTYTISNADLSVFYRIADGTLSPLQGPMDEAEFYSVLDTEVIKREGKFYAWTIPMAFPIPAQEKDDFKVGQRVAVKDQSGVMVGTLEITSIYPFDKARYNKAVYGTKRIDHPGFRMINGDQKEYLLGGEILAFVSSGNFSYQKHMLSPKATRKLFTEKGLDRIVAFQTRNALHRAHEYVLVHALEKLTKEGFFTGVVLNPLLGATKSDDIPAEIRVKTYEVLINDNLLGEGDKDLEFWKTKDYSFDDQLLFIGLDMKMFYAGPKEAIMHAIYRQNQGFTNIIIGRKHADAPFDNGESLWGDFQAQDKFDNLSGELLIKPINIGFASYFEELGRVGLVEDFKNKGYHQVSISGKDLRQKLMRSEPIDERIMRKQIAEILSEFYRKE